MTLESNVQILVQLSMCTVVWVNSAALRIAGLDGQNPPTSTGTIIMLNKDNYCNGILLENAGNVLLDMAFNQAPLL